jgi:hypothetical protein
MGLIITFLFPRFSLDYIPINNYKCNESETTRATHKTRNWYFQKKKCAVAHENMDFRKNKTPFFYPNLEGMNKKWKKNYIKLNKFE